MSDRELLDALTVLAVRMGLLERGQRLVVEGDPRDIPAPPQTAAENPVLAGQVCGAPAPLSGDPDCAYLAGHRGAHSNDPTIDRA